MKGFFLGFLLFTFLASAQVTYDRVRSDSERADRVNFEFDSDEKSPISVVLRGSVDPQKPQQPDIAAFVRFAKELIPLPNSISESRESPLRWANMGCPIVSKSFTFCYYIAAELVLGWKVQNGDFNTDFYNVTYTPFAEGWAGANITIDSLPFTGGYGVYSSLVEAYAPVGVQIFPSGKLCAVGSYYVNPSTFTSRLNSKLKQCREEVLDDIIFTD